MLAHNVDSDMLHMTHRAALASLKKLSSESNNGGWEDCCHIKARLFMASDAFFCHVLRIRLSEFNEDLKEPSLGIKERYHAKITWPRPQGARVGHSVCIVRQVLGSNHRKYFFYKKKDDGYLVYVVGCVCLFIYV